MPRKCGMSKVSLSKNLETCLSSEEKALSLYEELFPLLADETDKIKIDTIIKDEKRHIMIVKDLMDVIRIYYVEQK